MDLHMLTEAVRCCLALTQNSCMLHCILLSCWCCSCMLLSISNCLLDGLLRGCQLGIERAGSNLRLAPRRPRPSTTYASHANAQNGLSSVIGKG